MAKSMYLPGFSHVLYGRRTSAVASKVQRRTHRLDGLAALVARFIPEELFAPAGGRRQRI